MGFKPQGMAGAFNKSEGAAQQRKSVIDLLVTIDSYDLGQRQLNCTGQDGSKMMVQIRPETIARNLKRTQELDAQGARPQFQKWEGFQIDQRMAEHLPPGHKVTIEKVERVRTINHNGAVAYLVNSDRVINLADQAPNKAFEGLFSISTYQNNIFHVQHWEEKAISIENIPEMDRIRAQLDEDSKAFLNKELRPHHGVQFRVVVPAKTPTEKGTVIDTSACFDWISRVVDANGNEIIPGKPLDADKFNELLFDEARGYLSAYVDKMFPDEKYPGRFIEVVFYTNYRAGPRSRYMVIPDRQFDPLYRLAYTQTKLAMDDNEFVQGKNVAVRGVLQLSSDQADMQTRTFKSRNIAVRLHANGIIGHVHSWIRDHLGNKTQPHESLRQVNVNRVSPGEKQSIQQQTYTTAPVPQPESTQAGTFSGDYDDWDDFDENPFNENSLRQKLNDAQKNLEGE